MLSYSYIVREDKVYLTIVDTILGTKHVFPYAKEYFFRIILPRLESKAKVSEVK